MSIGYTKEKKLIRDRKLDEPLQTQLTNEIKLELHLHNTDQWINLLLFKFAALKDCFEF